MSVFASDYDDYDNAGSRGGYIRKRSRSPLSHRRRHLGDRVSSTDSSVDV